MSPILEVSLSERSQRKSDDRIWDSPTSESMFACKTVMELSLEKERTQRNDARKWGLDVHIFVNIYGKQKTERRLAGEIMAMTRDILYEILK